VFAARIVEAVDVFENGDFDLSSCLPVSAPDHFGFEGFEKALDSCVVIAIALSAHGRCHTMFSQDLLIVVRTVLAAAVRVVNAALWGPAQGNSHVQGADRQVFLHPVADGPCCYPKGFCVQNTQGDHPTGMQVQDDGQIDPAFARPDIGDVADPFLVGLARSKIPLQEIWRDVEYVIAVGSCFEFMGSHNANRVLAHQTPHPAVPNTQAHLVQLFRHSGPTIAALAQSVLLADMRQKHHVAPLPMRYRPILPSPKATIRNPHHAADMCHRKGSSIVIQKRELHGFWAAKN
jgi:hypothetical protein